MAHRAFVSGIEIKNFKSIQACDIELQPLTFLVGPNGSGKSNFLDTFQFVSDALLNSLEFALRARGGFEAVRWRWARPDEPVEIRMRLRIGTQEHGRYAFAFTADRAEAPHIIWEEGTIFASSAHPEQTIRVVNGEVGPPNAPPLPAASAKHLYLPFISERPGFNILFQTLRRMMVYNPEPALIRLPQLPDTLEALKQDGSNLAAILDIVLKDDEHAETNMLAYLRALLPGFGALRVQTAAGYKVLEALWRHRERGGEEPFPATALSDGTLRFIAILTALAGPASSHSAGPTLVGIEEPERGLHSYALDLLMDAFQAASERVQVLTASHSSDLLDRKGLDPASVVAVTARQGESRIGHLGPADLSVLRDKLFTPGELMRAHDLAPAEASPASVSVHPG